MNPEVLLFTNQKGGVGKTTLVREMGFYLSKTGYSVLLIDCDSQGNLSKGLIEGSPGLYEALEDREINFKKVKSNLYLLSGDSRLNSFEKRLTGEIDAYSRVYELLLKEEFNKFDFILLDTPPSLGTLTINALAASKKIIIPMSPSLYSMQGANDLIATISKVRKSLNPDLTILGVVINAFDSIPVITRQIKAEIETSFGQRVFSSVIPKSIRIEEAIAKRCSVLSLKGKTEKIEKAIESLGDEIITRLRKGYSYEK